MKKSLDFALKEAVFHSKAFPNVTVRVMDKPNKRALINTLDELFNERIREGYKVIAEFKNGERVK